MQEEHLFYIYMSYGFTAIAIVTIALRTYIALHNTRKKLKDAHKWTRQNES